MNLVVNAHSYSLTNIYKEELLLLPILSYYQVYNIK